MRDLKKERGDSDAKVASANAKVVAQTEMLSKMSPDDPARISEERLLHQMQQSAASAQMNQAMVYYDAEKQ